MHDDDASSKGSTATTVYNFEVASTHTYFVGSKLGGVWVHNACGVPNGFENSGLEFTQEGDGFYHYGYQSQAGNFAGGLNPGSFATDIGSYGGSEAQSGLALPNNPLGCPDCVYEI